MPKLPDDEWRVEVELDDERHGYSLSERLRSHDLDDEARERLGGRVIVTRDGSCLFLYTKSADAAREAERVVRELLVADGLTGETSLTRWDEEQDAWVSDTGEVVESNRDEDGLADWFVRIESEEPGAVGELAERLRAEGLPVERRGRYLLIGSHDDDEVRALAERVRAVAGPRDDVQVRADVGDLPSPGFVFFEAHKPGIARDLGL
jgi:hypothetical protein